MAFLLIFSFLAGIVTVLSPCILPVLPIVLSTSVGAVNSRLRPLGVIFGFIASFTFFTLFLASIVRVFGIHPDVLRLASIFVIAGFGLSLIVPKFQLVIEQLFTKISNAVPSSNSTSKSGFIGGVLVGFSLGLLWTPCVGPILASVISLAITGSVTLSAFFITLAYSIGTAIPMLVIMLGGRTLLQKNPWLTKNLSGVQKGFGVLMIATAISIFFNVDRKIQTIILDVFPQYGVGLTKIEDNKFVQDQLQKVNENDYDKKSLGKPMDEVLLYKGPLAPELIAGGQWFNSQPLTLEGLRGKVVLVDFWTYTCINCQRTFPYLTAWWEKYKDAGLVIIGVHSPEFEFEKDPSNLAQAIADFSLLHPIMQDNDFATWRAYNNRYWPAKYLIDKEGYIRYTHFGEGSYDETERVIQRLLQEGADQKIDAEIENPTYQTYSKTPEIYLGYFRMANFASPQEIVPDSIQTYSQPARLRNNEFAFEGPWFVSGEYANPQKGASLNLNFESKEVYLVMNSKNGPAKVRVYVDGVQQAFGEDVVEGVVDVSKDRLYKLVKLPVPGRHILRLEFEDGNVEVFAFTFG